MLPRTKRLPRAAFPNVLSRGRHVSSPNFTATFSKEAHGYAVVVPKKVARLSITRHKIKRRVLEVLRTLPLPPEALIFFPKAPVKDMGHKEVCEELATLLSKIH